MPTDQPNSAADLPVEAREPDTVGAVMDDARLDDAGGGGGLGGLAAADPLGGSAPATSGNARNAPIDLGVDAGDAKAATEARVLATDESEAHPS